MKNKLLIIFLIQFTLLMGQNGKDNFFPPTPEANSLMKYVDVPVNYSTGVTNYSIPIHTIKLKNLNIPITLAYQSSGCKPSEVAGNTGLGWDLSAGGKIVQNVVKQNDIDMYGPGNPAWNLPNDRDFKLPMPVSDLSWGLNPYEGKLDSIRGDKTDYTLFYNIDKSNLETQPDIFYYSTPNKSGKFFFGNNYETKQIPFGKEKIIFYTTSFEITDTDGVRYIYNIRTENLNLTENVCFKYPKLAGSSRSNSYTYYLAQIVTPNNETVDFIYDTVKYNLANDKDHTRYYLWFYGGGEKITSYSSEITTKVLTKIKVNQDYEIEFSYNKYRKDIKGKVQASAPKTLDNIKVKYKNDIETYQFDYGYFGIPESAYNPTIFEGTELNEDTGYILKLKSLQKTGENPYVFSYYNEEGVGRYIPCLDHWGYYSNSCSRYTMNTLFSDLGGTKEPDLEKTKTNFLKNITLPTKGEVEFNYELNTCSDCPISYTSYDWIPYGVNAYDGNDNFTGEEKTHIKDFIVPDNSITIPYVTFDLYSPGETTTSNYAIAEIYDEQWHLMNFQFIGTTGINNKPFEGDALVKGKKYYLVLRCYDTMENQNKFVSINFLYATENAAEIPSVGGLRIQNIKTKEANNFMSNRSFDYGEDGKSSGILYEKPFYFDDYSYFNEIEDPDANNQLTGLISYAVQYSRIPSDLFGFNGYHIFYKKVTERNIDTKDISNIIKVEKYFTFQDDIRYGDNAQFAKISYNWKRGLPSQINEFNKNEIVKKTMFSYHFLDTPAGSNTSKNEVGFPLMNATFPNEFHKRGIDINVYRRSESFYNIYLYSNSKLISAWYYMDKKTTEENFNGNILKTVQDFKYENPVSAQLTSQTLTTSEGTQTETKYYYPDDLLGEPFMTELKAANRISTPVITEQYKAGTLLSKNKTIFAKDASTGNLLVPKEIYAAKFPNTLPSLANNIGNLEKKITYNQYDDKGNILQYSPENAAPATIIWGYNKALPIAKIENATNAQVAVALGVPNVSALNETSLDAINALRNNASFANCMITTYTHIPLVGVSTITDPKGDKITYTYDSFGRLQFVKDKNGNILSENQYNYKQ